MPKFDTPDAPLPIYVKNGAGEFVQKEAHACAHCRVIRHDHDTALACCRQLKCPSCGKDVDWHGKCGACIDQSRLAKAVEIPAETYEGMVFDPSRDEYHADLDTFYDSVEPDELPDYVYACTVDKLSEEKPERIADRLIESLLSDHHDEAEADNPGELVEVIGKWLEKQTAVSWSVDYTRKIRVGPAPEQRGSDAPCSESEPSPLAGA